jgi:acetylornithine deacetylase/succinyl-diaminopimelate desuccinylase-like protein
MKNSFLATITFLLMLYHGTISLHAQIMSKQQILQAADEYFLPAVQQYRDFLTMPNDGHYPEQIQSHVDWCLKTFDELGFETQVLTTEGAPQVFAQKTYKPGGKSLLFYMQIDGQPVDTAAWDQESPYQPVLKEKTEEGWKRIPWEEFDANYNPEWRVFARSASDSKGPAMAFITALKVLKEKNITPDFNIKAIMDFQEEMGSPSLPPAVKKYRDLMDAEMLLIMDGTRHLSNLPTLTFGARGIATATLTVYGARRDLHSGQYGNFSPNPVFKLSQLIAGMKDEDGRVAIPGWYEGIQLSEKRKALINDVPEDQEEILRSLGIAQADKVGGTYQEALQYPSLNIRGLRAAWVGDEVRTIIPSRAIAEMDMRLVPESDGARHVKLLKEYIEGQGFHLIEGEPTDEERAQYPKLASFTYRIGSKPFRTELDSDIGEWLGKAMERVYGKNYVRMATTGGSQPIAPFISTLGVPAVSVRIPNPDNSIHAPNENLRLGNFLEGIQMCLAVLTQKFP